MKKVQTYFGKSISNTLRSTVTATVSVLPFYMQNEPPQHHLQKPKVLCWMTEPTFPMNKLAGKKGMVRY